MAGATKAQLTEGITMRSNSGTKRWLLSALLGGITLVPFGQTFAADPLEVVPESSEAEADAIAFRETFGLASQLDLIREAALDPSYSADIYGVPLSAAEINELLRRAEIQASLGPAIRFAADLETYGGTYIDQLDDGRPVFLFADDPDKYTASIASRLPKDTAFRARQVQRTEAALLATQASLDAAWEALAKEGIEVVSTGIVTNANIVRVGVRGLTTGAEERLQGEFGPGLVVLEDSPGGADACVDHNNCRPMKGGLAINASISGTPCTSGYVVKRVSNGQLHLLTAGHCLDPLVSDPFDTTWLHHADSFGRSREETWLKNGTRDADVGLITIFSPEYPTDRNQFYYGPHGRNDREGGRQLGRRCRTGDRKPSMSLRANESARLRCNHRQECLAR